VLELSNSEIKLTILRIYAKRGASDAKYNVIGKPNAPGTLEMNLKTEFSSDERNRARIAIEELVEADLLRPTMSDGQIPDQWYEITDKGRAALERNALDELDEALRKIDPHLVEIRRGAWSALHSKHPDSLRQAAHSARELIDQTLKTGAPNDVITSQPGFVADKSSSDGVTRRMRIRLLMMKERGHISDTDLEVAEKAGDLVIAIDKRLMAASHARSVPLEREIKDALTAAELALRNVCLK
jgi:Predicted pPIWI-associating nuclease